MTDWVKNAFDEAEAARQKKDAAEYLINFSNYWLSLRKRIDDDVAEINNLWKEKLGSHPITIHDTQDGYKIVKSGLVPTVGIYLRNRGSEVDCDTVIFNGASKESTERVLAVESDGHGIILRDGYMRYVVPEEASRFILGPIIEALTND